MAEVEKSQLLALLRCLTTKELKEVRKFLISPLFNQRKDVVDLFDLLIKKIKKGKLDFNKEQIFLRIYPSKKFNAQGLRQVQSWLQKLIEKYLAYQSFMDNDIEVKLKMLTIFRERNLPRHLQKSINEIENLLGSTKLRNVEYYQNSFALDFEKQIASSTKRMSARNFEALSKNLDYAFIVKKLHQACLTVAHQAVYHFEIDQGILSEILAYIEKKNLKDNPSIASYWYCYMALSHPEEKELFTHFKNLLLEHQQRFSKTELRDLYLLAINYCIRRLNDGDKYFAREGFSLYQTALASDLLLLDEVMSRFTFRNIVAIGLKIKEYDWVEKFINEYQPFLEEAYKESAYALNLATLEYDRNNLNLVLQHLQVADHKDLLMNLSAKTLAAKTYFELDEIMLLESHLQTMQIFIQRKKVIGYHRKNYLNFIRYLKKIISLPEFAKDKKWSLREKILAEEILTEKEWLIAKIQF